MSSTSNISSRQLELARRALWHQNGNALTTEAARMWIAEAGLLPVYPLPQFPSPVPSFAEAVLGRPENGWVPHRHAAAAGSAPDGSAEDSFAEVVEDEEPEDDFAEDADEEFSSDAGDGEAGGDGSVENDLDDDSDASDEDQPATGEGDAAMLAGDGNIPADRETMLSDDDEFAEDEGDEIAEEDRIAAGDDPLPNDLTAKQEEPDAPVVNGFSAEERETVHRVLARLIEDGTAVPLNLLGGATGEPDYVVGAAAFSYVYTLRGDKNWKNEPATTGPMRVSPLAVKAYAVLQGKAPQAVHAITAELGQGITDSATLRALNELWAIGRVLPVPSADGEPARWEPMGERYLRHMKAGANAGQPTALSALLSLYLGQAIAATTEEMEVFLSPLAARSRIREVVHGLSATQQLETVVVEGRTLLHISGTLPQMTADSASASAAEPIAPQRSRYEVDDRRAAMNERASRSAERGTSRDGDRASRPGSYPARRSAGVRDSGGQRPVFSRGSRPGYGGTPTFGERRPFNSGAGDRKRRPFTRSDAGTSAEQQEGSTPSFRRPWDEERSSAPRERKPFAPRQGGDRPFTPRGERPSTPRDGSERRPFTPRDGGERRPFTPRGDRPSTPRDGSERRPFTPRDGGERRPFTPRGDRPSTPREGGERRPFTPRDGGERRPFTPRGERPFTPQEGGERRPFTPRDGGERRPFTPRGERPFTPRDGSERRPFTPREGGERRPFAPRESNGTGGGGGRKLFGGGGGRPGFGGGRPFTPREGGDSRPPRSTGPGRFSGEPGEGRPSFQAGAHSAGPGGSKFGGSGFGRDRGGKGGKPFNRPGGRPAQRGPGSGPGRGGAPRRRPE